MGLADPLEHGLRLIAAVELDQHLGQRHGDVRGLPGGFVGLAQQRQGAGGVPGLQHAGSLVEQPLPGLRQVLLQ